MIGDAWDETGPTTQYSETIFADLDISPCGTVDLAISSVERALYLLEGNARIDGVQIDPHKLAILDPDSASVLATERGRRALLLGGARCLSPRFIKGTFVGSSEVRLQHLSRAYKQGPFPSIDDSAADDRSFKDGMRQILTSDIPPIQAPVANSFTGAGENAYFANFQGCRPPKSTH